MYVRENHPKPTRGTHPIVPLYVYGKNHPIIHTYTFVKKGGGGWPCYILCSLNVTCHRLGGRSALIGAPWWVGSWKMKCLREMATLFQGR